MPERQLASSLSHVASPNIHIDCNMMNASLRSFYTVSMLVFRIVCRLSVDVLWHGKFGGAFEAVCDTMRRPAGVPCCFTITMGHVAEAMEILKWSGYLETRWCATQCPWCETNQSVTWEKVCDELWGWLRFKLTLVPREVGLTRQKAHRRPARPQWKQSWRQTQGWRSSGDTPFRPICMGSGASSQR